MTDTVNIAPARSARTAMQVMPSGVMHVPVTPFTSDNEIDFPTYEKLIDFHIANGTSSLCVILHIAESLNLTLAERMRLAETSVKSTAGWVPVIINVSTAGTDDAITLARHAERIGADAICLISPYYWPVSEESQYRHFTRVFDSVRIPAIGYNSPLLQASVSLKPAMVIRLAEQFEHFIGLKEASHNFETFIELRRAARSVRPMFSMILGVEYILPSVILGGVGAMSIFGGIAPRLAARLDDAAVNGRLDEARDLQDRASHLWQLFKVEYPAAIKAAMAMMGRPVGPTRGPMMDLDPERTSRLHRDLEALGIFNSEPHGWA
jgi:dihydrodipicolinate synthase/N-acetylneuraminate lyase